MKRSRSRRKPTPPIETKSKRCESVRLLSPKGSSVPISESSSSISVKQVWKICRTKSLRGTTVSSVSISFWRSPRETQSQRQEDSRPADREHLSEGQIRSLTAQIDQIKAELWEKINNLTDKLRGAYESLTNVVKAVGMLKYDREKDQNGNYTYGKYGISNLSKAQDKLIDGWQSMELSGRKRTAFQRWQRRWKSVSVSARALRKS